MLIWNWETAFIALTLGALAGGGLCWMILDRRWTRARAASDLDTERQRGLIAHLEADAARITEALSQQDVRYRPARANCRKRASRP